MSFWRVVEGDALERLRELESGSVQTCVTSPPYFGLRDYGTGEWAGGDEGCDHTPARVNRAERVTDAELEACEASGRGPTGWRFGKDSSANRDATYRELCGKCGATRTDSQVGLEATPDEYVARLVEVFREVRRVLRDDGTLWLNLGDSYAGGGRGGGVEGSTLGGGTSTQAESGLGVRASVPGYKPKDLLGIPWMVAKALQAPYYTGTIKDERDRIWLAAMIDAEGCMFIHKRKVGQSNGQGYVRKNDSYGSGLEVSSTDRCIVDRIMQITGRGSICEQTPQQNERRKQTIYRWNLRSNECREVIREVYPHLVAKQYEARLAIGCPSSGPDAERAHESLKAIHQGGTPDIDFAAPASMFEGGWFLRSDIIWSKLPMPNPMPESVTDRPTKAHEYVFLLSKGPRYFYDCEGIRESGPEHTGNAGTFDRNGSKREAPIVGQGYGSHRPNRGDRVEPGRNKRSVWTVATQPFPGAHFAVFPPKLIEPCVKAGSAEDACGVCGAPWVRVVERTPMVVRPTEKRAGWQAEDDHARTQVGGTMLEAPESRTVGFESSCDHQDKTGSSTVLDPFSGAGTTGLVATRLGRSYVGIELNPAYAEMSRERIRDDAPLMNYILEREEVA